MENLLSPWYPLTQHSCFKTHFLFLSPFSQAHTHHYLDVDGFEMEHFAEAQESLTSLIAEYTDFYRQMGKPPETVSRLEILS